MNSDITAQNCFKVLPLVPGVRDMQDGRKLRRPLALNSGLHLETQDQLKMVLHKSLLANCALSIFRLAIQKRPTFSGYERSTGSYQFRFPREIVLVCVRRMEKFFFQGPIRFFELHYRVRGVALTTFASINEIIRWIFSDIFIILRGKLPTLRWFWCSKFRPVKIISLLCPAVRLM